MNAKSILIGVFIICCFPLAAQQQYYVEASRNAIVREDHNKNATPILRLERGDQLNAVTSEQTDRFYNVYLPNGETGWVSSYVVRLYEGNAPDAAPVAVMPDVGGGLTVAEREYATFHLAIGKPKGYKELYRRGFVIGYDPTRKIPLWVQYRLTRERSEDNTYPRPNAAAFDEDVEIHITGRATLDDYASVSSDYVRGHLAPADDMRWDEIAANESMLLSNMSPQIGSEFNNSIWKTLENRVRRWAIAREDITIICGPVFEARQNIEPIPRQNRTLRQMLYNVVGENDVAVPTSFFKIIVDMRNLQNPNVIAFLMPHIRTTAGDERDIENYLTSVDNIEELTGLDFLTGLSDVVQETIETRTAQDIW